MKIDEIVLYGNNDNVRRLDFSKKNMNIITGKSKTGKSSIGDIIEYCLGRTECKIAEGVIKDNVAWYGLLLNFGTEKIFIARQKPSGQKSTLVYYERGGLDYQIPSTSKNFSNIGDVDKLNEMLSDCIGISDNQIVTKGNTYSASFKQSLYYCFLSKTDIVSNSILFHRQNENTFLYYDMRYTLLYFLNLIDNKFSSLQNQINDLNSKIEEEYRISEKEKVAHDLFFEKIHMMINEAKDLGLLDNKAYNDDSILEILNQIVKDFNGASFEFTEDNNKINELNNMLVKLESEIKNITNQINELNKYKELLDSAKYETKEQKVRLDSIGLFKQVAFDKTVCPLCHSKLEYESPDAEAIRVSVMELNKQLEQISIGLPQVDEKNSELLSKRKELIIEKKKLNEQVDFLTKSNEENKKLKELYIKQAKLIGKLSLLLENGNHKIDSNRIKRIDDMKAELDALKKKMKETNINDEKNRILSLISQDISKWAKELEVEHSQYPFRLDIDKLTLLIDKKERTFTFDELGSSDNIVKVHLIVNFAIHKFFIENEMPVPRFLFIDQPSLAYFQNPSDDDDSDIEEMRVLYKFIFDRINELKGQLQVIVVDHARLDEDYFRNNILEEWRNGNALIPSSWITNN